MKRTANSAELIAPASGALFGVAVAATSFFWRNPGVAGGSTAFAVAFLFVSANAVWYQDHRHPAPLFATQAYAVDPLDGQRAEKFRIIRDNGEMQADPRIAHVQRELAARSLYSGAIDGMAGPRTRAAVAAYRASIGLEADGEIDAALLENLNYKSAIPHPSPAPRDVSLADKTGSVNASGGEPAEDVAEIQGALVRLGYPGIDIDGVLGAKTRAAIRDFQEMNRLEANGKANAVLLKALMRAAPKG